MNWTVVKRGLLLGIPSTSTKVVVFSCRYSTARARVFDGGTLYDLTDVLECLIVNTIARHARASCPRLPPQYRFEFSPSSHPTKSP